MNESWNPAGSQPLREEQVTQAVRFLTDSRTRTATQTDKESFLRQKGLTDAEISAAFARSNASTVTSLRGSPLNDPQNPSRPLYIPPPVIEEPIVWSALKSIFSAVGAMALGILGYHVYQGTQLPQEIDKQQISTGPSVGSSSSFQPSQYDLQKQLETEIRRITVEQELRHKELLIAIRELSTSVEGKGKATRKPGGSVVTDFGVNSSENETTVVQEDVPDISAESIDLEAEVTRAIDDGIDATIQLVLSNIEKNKKLNKSNLKFKKLDGNSLLSYCGYRETADFFELRTDHLDAARNHACTVTEEIKRARESRKQHSHPEKKEDPPAVPDIDSETVHQSDSPSAPWLPVASKSNINK